jgi:O-antigen ligase
VLTRRLAKINRLSATFLASIAGQVDPRFLLLTAFLFGISAFHREFAHLSLSIGGIPLFPGELTLGLLIALEAIRLLRGQRIAFRMRGSSFLWGMYLLLGVVYAAIGLARGHGLAALRDFALVYYAVLFFLVQAVLQVEGDATRLFTWVAIGSAVGSTWTAGSFLVTPQLTFGHGASGSQALVAWLALAYLVSTSGDWGGRWRRWRWLAAVPLFVVIYLAGYRTMIGVAVMGVVVAAAWTVLARGPARSDARRLAVAGVAVCLVFAASVLAVRLALGGPAPGSPTHGEVSLPQGLRVITNRWVRLFGGDSEPSAAFRAVAWAKAVARIQSHPWTGIGFGPEPDLYPSSYCDTPESPISNCGNAHNTYLTLAMRMGIPGFGLWAVGSLWVVGDYLRATLARRSDKTVVREAAFLWLVLVSLLVFAFFSLFFESPYLSPFYWVTLGVMAERTRRLSVKGAHPDPTVVSPDGG